MWPFETAYSTSCSWDPFILLPVISSSPLFIAEQYSVVWMYHSLFSHLPILRHFVPSPLQFLAIINKTSITILSYLSWVSYKKHVLGHVMFRLSPFNAIIDVLRLKSVTLRFVFSSIFFSLCLFSCLIWITWTFFRIPFWFINSIFECVFFYTFLGILLYIHIRS